MKQVWLDVAGRMHSLHAGLISSPPEGYRVTRTVGEWDEVTRVVSRLDPVYSTQKHILGHLVPMNLVKAGIDGLRQTPEWVDLTYANGHVVFRKEPWVVDLEYVTHLSGYSRRHFRIWRRQIEKLLKSSYCRKIMPWTDAGKQTIFAMIHDEEILDKVETVHLSVPPKEFSRSQSNDCLTLLFVGSINIPKDFEIKGGREVLEAFTILNREYRNLRLIVRSYVPDNLRQKYGGQAGIRIIDSPVAWSDLEKIFMKSDIFMFPSHNTPGLVFLDAMSYELPIITTNVWANGEMVEDGKNGFLVHRSSRISYVNEDMVPAWSEPDSLRTIHISTDPAVVSEVVEKTRILIEDEKLRKSMGKTGRLKVEKGDFSLERRNQKLRRIFDEATV